MFSTDKALELASFSIDANKNKHVNFRNNKPALNSVDFVAKSIKHLLAIGYMEKIPFSMLIVFNKS